MKILTQRHRDAETRRTAGILTRCFDSVSAMGATDQRQFAGPCSVARRHGPSRSTVLIRGTHPQRLTQMKHTRILVSLCLCVSVSLCLSSPAGALEVKVEPEVLAQIEALGAPQLAARNAAFEKVAANRHLYVPAMLGLLQARLPTAEYTRT